MKKIEQLVKELSKEGHIVKLAKDLRKTEKIRTGVFALDYVLDGGISQCEGGHRLEFWGAESSGKTTFALLTIKKYQELEKICVFIDVERSYDPVWGKILGVDDNNLIIIYPDTLEDFGDLLIELIPEVDLIVVDSIVGLIPLAESERDTEQVQVAAQARVNSLITRKIYGAVGDRPVTFIFINQMRQKIGVLYGSPNTSAGGLALKHMYSTRIEFRAGKPIKEGDEKVGLEIKLNCIKNKKGRPHRVAEIDFSLSGAIDNTKSLFYAGLKYGAIERSGNTYTFDKIKAIGKDKFIDLLTDKDLTNLESEIWKVIK